MSTEEMMSETNSASAPVWFWIIGALAIAWNAMGVMSYVTTVGMSPETLAAMAEAERALFENTPTVINAAFAIAVFAGLGGSVLLLLRKKLAHLVFLVSFAAIIAQFTYWLLMTNSIEVYGFAHAVTMPALVTIIGVFLIWFSKIAKGKGWLG